ncbi:VCBS repeat-containing protein [Streptomyces sp. NPDC016845]|uniref:VCBS repeat-containing protein n=1 Tax=Streptomyces sp. NPDC016845 TaxID=3364972 RepID=UPI0037BD1971
MRLRLLVTATAAALAATGLTLPAAGAAGAAPALRGDFNGDRYQDLAVGVPDATVAGKAQAGYVNVVWGGPGGLGSKGSTTISQNSPGVSGGAEAYDRFGAAVESADTDGDGYADLVVSAPGEDIAAGTTDSEGMISVVRGAPGGFAGGFSVAKGAGAFSAIGEQLAVADFDADGDLDLALGVAGDENGSLAWRPGPLTTTTADTTSRIAGLGMGGRVRDLATGDFDGDGVDNLAVTWRALENSAIDVYTWDAADKPLKSWSTPDFGQSLAAADLDRDGVDDLAVGLLSANPDSEDGRSKWCADLNGGTVLMLHGAEGAGLGGDFDCVTQSSPGVPGNAEADDDFGYSLAAGDTDADGYPELAVGVDSEAIGGAKNAGMVVVLEGTADGPVSGGYGYHQGSADVPGTVEAGDRFGSAVALGDFGSDARADLVVSAPQENAGAGGVWSFPHALAPNSRALSPAGLNLTGAAKYGSVLAR